MPILLPVDVPSILSITKTSSTFGSESFKLINPFATSTDKTEFSSIGLSSLSAIGLSLTPLIRIVIEPLDDSVPAPSSVTV